MHIGALRNINTVKYKNLGADSGYDAINDFPISSQLAYLLNNFEKENHLPKTIIFNCNPNDSKSLLSICYAFSEEKIKGKVQLGSPWWFNNTISGIRQYCTDLTNNGMLGIAFGTVSDSRSILSMSRHGFFRRILCNYIGEQVDLGLMPWDKSWLSTLLKNICVYNCMEFHNEVC